MYTRRATGWDDERLGRAESHLRFRISTPTEPLRSSEVIPVYFRVFTRVGLELSSPIWAVFVFLTWLFQYYFYIDQRYPHEPSSTPGLF